MNSNFIRMLLLLGVFIMMALLVYYPINEVPAFGRPEVSSHAIKSGAEDSTQTITCIDDIHTLINELIVRSFPELTRLEIKILPFESTRIYFQTLPELSSVLLPWRSTQHRIHYNSTLFEKQLPRQAARGVLAHELAHLVDYVSGKGLLKAGLNELRKGTHRRLQERFTDLEAISRGYGTHLARYREWIYEQLETSQSIQAYQTIYLSPHDIRHLENLKHNCFSTFHMLFKKLGNIKRIQDIKCNYL